MPSLDHDLKRFAAVPVRNYQYRILVRRGRRRFYVSGHPFTLTEHAARAFVFSRRSDARTVIARHFADRRTEILVRRQF